MVGAPRRKYGVTGQTMGCPRRSIVTYSVVIDRSKTSSSRSGRAAVIAVYGTSALVAGLARQHHARHLPGHDDARLDGHDLAPAGVGQGLVGRREPLEL